MPPATTRSTAALITSTRSSRGGRRGGRWGLACSISRSGPSRRPLPGGPAGRPPPWRSPPDLVALGIVLTWLRPGRAPPSAFRPEYPLKGRTRTADRGDRGDSFRKEHPYAGPSFPTPDRARSGAVGYLRVRRRARRARGAPGGDGHRLLLRGPRAAVPAVGRPGQLRAC